tara:strand:+ start:2977 stop:3603 length:627 start_codon:yes stop_codon:yes gene_type:complete
VSDYNRRNQGSNTASQPTTNRRISAGADLAANGLPRSTRYMVVGNSFLKVATNKITELFDTLAELRINGFTQETYGQNADSRMFAEILSAMGFETVSNDELSPGIDNLKNFSFMSAVNNDETIENTNIVDPYLENLTPVKIPTTDKFKGAADAFYELDDRRPDSLNIFVERQKRERFTKLRVFAQQLANVIKKSKNKMITRNNRNFVL